MHVNSLKTFARELIIRQFLSLRKPHHCSFRNNNNMESSGFIILRETWTSLIVLNCESCFCCCDHRVRNIKLIYNEDLLDKLILMKKKKKWREEKLTGCVIILTRFSLKHMIMQPLFLKCNSGGQIPSVQVKCETGYCLLRI